MKDLCLQRLVSASVVDIAANVMRFACLLFVFVVCSSYIQYDCWRFTHFFSETRGKTLLSKLRPTCLCDKIKIKTTFLFENSLSGHYELIVSAVT